MNHQASARLLVAAIATALLPSVTAAGDADGRPLELRAIMQQLGAHMQTIAGAIAREDWALVARTAPQVGHHDQPPASEKGRILSYLGSEAARFRGLDEKTHEAAEALQQAAGQGNGAAAIDAFAKVQTGCLACHEQFRKPFVEHFYGKR